MVDKEEFPSNSHYHKVDASEEEKPEKKVEKIVRGEVTERKKSLADRFRSAFAGDDARTVGSYIFSDVVIPAFQDMLQEAIEQGSRGIIYGLTSGRKTGGGNKPGYTAYNRVYTHTSRPKPAPENPNRARHVHSLPEYIFDSRGDAEGVLDDLTMYLDEYGTVSVSDYKGLMGKTGEFTDDNWGWTNLSNAQVARTRGGWIIDMPRPKPLSD